MQQARSGVSCGHGCGATVLASVGRCGLSAHVRASAWLDADVRGPGGRPRHSASGPVAVAALSVGAHVAAPMHPCPCSPRDWTGTGTPAAPPCAAHPIPFPCPFPQAGGCLTYLHGGKPFIRGGDFTQRQALGERPMQLNYSRAFGGKDLKQCAVPRAPLPAIPSTAHPRLRRAPCSYGLTVEPDVTSMLVQPKHRMLLLASDGVWDVLSPEEAADCAVTAVSEGRCAPWPSSTASRASAHTCGRAPGTLRGRWSCWRARPTKRGSRRTT